ncbi:MAG TPA: hypothetical protein VGX25_27670 [Actinophytocola sp.]|uniref:hypothetical protein n=1 Tax=Actinophytocola sp. TaxID=1872138 RepID=UPI002DDDA0C7|nr:hypothetical protein [Actinophytocola sp.]HEV2783179.1 hypothetical protein [Actinophytocola sp.]
MTASEAPAVPGGRFALFADCLLLGCCTAIAALPVVTAYPALVATCAVLRERVLDDRSVGPVRYLRTLGQVVRSGLSGLVVPPLLCTALVLDALTVVAGVPGSGLLAVFLAVAGSVAAVIGLRAAAAWRPGTRWPDVARAAAIAAVRDPGGSALLLLAAAAAVGIAFAVPVTVLLLAGPLALAAVTVDVRTGAR